MRRYLISLLASCAIASSALAQAPTAIPSPYADGWLARGAMMLSDADVTGATASLAQYGRLAGRGHSEADLLYARALMLSGRLADARELLRRWLQQFPGHASRQQAASWIGDTYLMEGRWADAVKAMGAVDARGLDGKGLARHQYALGYGLLMLGEYDKARAAFGSIPSYGPPEYYNAGRLYLAYIDMRQGRYREALEGFLRVNPDIEPGQTRPYYLGQAQYILGDYKEALAEARKAEKLSLPQGLEAENLRVIGECLYRDGDASGALPYLRRYASMCEHPQPSALYILGVACYDDGQWQEAVDRLTPVAQQCDDAMGQSAYLRIGESYVRLGDPQAALLAFNHAVEMPFDAEIQETAYYDYAVATVEGAKVPFTSSVKVLEDFLSRYPRSQYAPQVQRYVIDGYMTDNDYDAALQAINRISRPSVAVLRAKQRVLYTLGRRDLSAGRLTQAAERLREASALARYDAGVAAETTLLLGDVAYRQDRYDEASKYYREYLDNYGARAPNAALARYDLGYALMGQRQYDDAVIELQTAIQSGRLSEPLRADAYTRIGDARYYESQFDAAAGAYALAAEAAPSQADYPLYRESVMYGLARQYQRQLDGIAALIHRFPSSPYLPAALLDRAVAYGQLGRPAEAIDAYESLIQRYPSSPKAREAYIQMAQMLENSGQTSRAVEAYKHTVSAFPSSDEASVAVMALKRIGTDDGRITDYVAYIKGIPGAPAIDEAEVASLAFDAAEKAYADNGDLARLKDYVARYPNSQQTPDALAYLAANATGTEAAAYWQQIIDRFPHSPAATEALGCLADIAMADGRHQEAIDTYTMLLDKGGAADALRARQGIMRAAAVTQQWQLALQTAEQLLASASLASEDISEALAMKGRALTALGHRQQAREALREAVAAGGDDIHAAEAAVLLGEALLAEGDYAAAADTANKLVQTNSPHQYWLARAFIVLSDAKRAQGRRLEADEYLRALRNNYPGSEADIQQMITTRLGK